MARIEHDINLSHLTGKKILIGTPMYGGMCSGTYTVSLTKSIKPLLSLGINFGLSIISNESLITRARNEIVRRFLETDADYLIFIDADLGWGEMTIPTLLASERDVVCGVYPTKSINWNRIEDAAVNKGIKGAELEKYSSRFVVNYLPDVTEASTDEFGLIEVKHAGTGMMCIKREVFEKMEPHVASYRTSNVKDPRTGKFLHPITHEYFPTQIEDGVLLSEDYAFCHNWRELGGKIWLCPALSLSHMGTYWFSGNYMESELI